MVVKLFVPASSIRGRRVEFALRIYGAEWSKKKNNREKKKDAGVNAFETSLVEGDNCCHKSIYYDFFFIYIADFCLSSSSSTPALLGLKALKLIFVVVVGFFAFT